MTPVWARAHAAGTPADAAPEAPMPADELTPVPTRAAPDRDPVAAYLVWARPTAGSTSGRWRP
jgi:hypothetical protein